MAAGADAQDQAPLEKLWEDRPVRVDETLPVAEVEPALVIDVGGFEGPLDLLLHLARNQKVDLARISVLALAEQYLEFIESARRVRLELAADYLVMAAWLAYLKSRLLIPQAPKDDGPSGEEMAATLAYRLRRLEAIRDAAMRLVNRNRLGRDFFARGAPEFIPEERKSAYDASLYELLSAYANLRQRQAITNVTIQRRKVWSLADARLMLARLVGALDDWTALDTFLIRYASDPEERATAIASSFAATLELIRERRIEVRQEGAFQPIFMRTGSNPITDADLEAMEAGRD
ncbi:segregation and condensation protein A [Rhizobium sp. TRM95796]|uniref:segregation and condensation protein A n=1 Tax=Rhizobium sp. TRM95796 TaxID=2979862 RepID=UPI0021E813C7|nr:ScpA family protein [Rhizobium sp. TRM95796]MCV3765254.1 segregation/condensation protein A [Rhizobium sp. TRM95796]